jgi:hypothetical protein
MAEVRIGKGKIYLDRVENNKVELKAVDKLRYAVSITMTEDQLETLGKALIAYAKREKV